MVASRRVFQAVTLDSAGGRAGFVRCVECKDFTRTGTGSCAGV